MSVEQRKIDAHGHFFKSYLGPESPIDEYWNHTEKIGVVYCVASPGPSPEYETAQGIFRPAIWKSDADQHIHFVQQLVNQQTGEIIVERPSEENPYAVINQRLLDTAAERNATHEQKIFVMPIHHPTLDRDDEILNLIGRQDVAAIKFHGVAAFAGPKEVRPSVIKALNEKQKPIIVHTDYYAGVTSNLFIQACQLNNPIEWVRWAIDTDVSILITHAARLSREALMLAKGHKNIVIGCAPDILQSSEPDHLFQPTNDYYADLFRMIPSSQIVFDIDYGWNVRERNKWDTNDWDMTNRLEVAAEKTNLKNIDLEAIYFDNASRFFRIP